MKLAMLQTRAAPLGPLHKLPCRRLNRRVRISAVDVNQGASPDMSQADGTGFGSPPAYPLYQAPQYQLAPQAPPIPPPAPVASAPAATGAPFWVWILLGAAVMWLYSKFQELRKNPAAALMGMMGKMNGGGQGGAAAGGGQDMSAMMEMMKQMQSQGGGGGFPGAAPSASPFAGMPSSGTTIPTTAQDVSPSDRDGSKFEQNKQPAPYPAAAQPAATQAAAPAQQPAAAGSGASPGFFADAAAAAAAGQQGAPAAASFFTDTGAPGAPQGAAGSPQESEATETLIENMLQMVVDNPELQKQMNTFLPENMRDENTWKWIASSPDLRKQIAKQMAPNFNPEAMSSFTQQTGPAGVPNPGGVDMDKAMEEMKAQGVDPSNYMSEMMADPEVMELFMKPHVTEALMEIQKNPQSAVNYMSDPDVSKLMSKMMSIQSKIGGPMPGMPPGGMPPGGMPAGMPGGAMPDLAAAAAAAGVPPPNPVEPASTGTEAVTQPASTKKA